MKALKPVLQPVVFLTLIIAALSLVAAATGVFWHTGGSAFQFTTLRGETVTMHGDGLYRYESVSGASQVIAQDIVTLCIGIPLLLVSLRLFVRGSLRGKLLLGGTLGYFLYTYATMCFLAAYNSLFLVYLALFSASLFAFVLTLMSIEVSDLPAHFSNRFPRKLVAGVCIFVGVMLAMLWLGRIVPALMNNAVPAGLESYTTLVIQVLDLGIIVPAAFVSGILLLRKKPIGHLFSSVLLVKGVTMGAATSAMVAGQMSAGVATSPVEMIMFPLFTVAFVVTAALMLRSVSSVPLPVPESSAAARLDLEHARA